jgi:ketosteroid isomerase-like protein
MARRRAARAGGGGGGACGRPLRPGAALLALAAAAAAAGCAGALGRGAGRGDEAEIARLPLAFAWAVDARDLDALTALFAEGIVYDLSAYGFPPTTGRAAVRELFRTGVFPYVRCSTIVIANVRVEVAGDFATGADYFVHYGYDPRDAPPGTRSHTEGRHFYEFVREAGAWKISRIRGEPHFERREPYDPAGLRACR